MFTLVSTTVILGCNAQKVTSKLRSPSGISPAEEQLDINAVKPAKGDIVLRRIGDCQKVVLVAGQTLKPTSGIELSIQSRVLGSKGGETELEFCRVESAPASWGGAKRISYGSVIEKGVSVRSLMIYLEPAGVILSRRTTSGGIGLDLRGGVLLSGGKTSAFDKTGARRWISAESSGRGPELIASDDDRAAAWGAAVASDDKSVEIHRWSARTGKPVPGFPTKLEGAGNPRDLVVDPETGAALVASVSGAVSLARIEEMGEVLWKVDLSEDCELASCGIRILGLDPESRTIRVGVSKNPEKDGGTVMSLDLDSGDIMDESEAQGFPLAQDADGALFSETTALLAGAWKTKLAKWDETGTEKAWEAELPGRLFSAIRFDSNLDVIALMSRDSTESGTGSTSRDLVKLRGEDGKLLWSREIRGVRAFTGGTLSDRMRPRIGVNARDESLVAELIHPAATSLVFPEDASIPLIGNGTGAPLGFVALYSSDGTRVDPGKPAVAPAPRVVLKSISPVSGSASGGTLITLNGENFVSGMTVELGGTGCAVTEITDARILCKTAAHAAGAVGVQVSGSAGVDTLEKAFTFVADPTYRLEPSRGSVSQAVEAKLTGPNVGGARVLLNGTELRSYYLDANALRVQIPIGPQIGAVNLTVESGGKTTTFRSAYTYEASLNKLSRSTGSIAGGDILSISGTGVEHPTAEVRICGVKADLIARLTNDLRVSIPAPQGNSVTCDVEFVVGDSKLVQRAAFKYQTAVREIKPASAKLPYTVSITITGENLRGGQILLEGEKLKASYDPESDSLQAWLPASETAGTRKVEIQYPNGKTFPIAGGFSYLPSITSMTSIGDARGGGTGEVRGYGFTPEAKVVIDGVPAETQFASKQFLNFIVPPVKGAGGLKQAYVQVGAFKAEAESGFRYNPNVTQVTPDHLPLSGGTVRVEGFGLDPSLEVTMNDQLLQTKFIDSKTLEVNVPRRSSPSTEYLYIRPLKSLRLTFDWPTVESMNPASGPTEGGNVVTIKGTQLDMLRFTWPDNGGETSLKLTSVKPTEVTFVVPPQGPTGSLVYPRAYLGSSMVRAFDYRYQSSMKLSISRDRIHIGPTQFAEVSIKGGQGPYTLSDGYSSWTLKAGEALKYSATRTGTLTLTARDRYYQLSGQVQVFQQQVTFNACVDTQDRFEFKEGTIEPDLKSLTVTHLGRGSQVGQHGSCRDRNRMGTDEAWTSPKGFVSEGSLIKCKKAKLDLATSSPFRWNKQIQLESETAPLRIRINDPEGAAAGYSVRLLCEDADF